MARNHRAVKERRATYSILSSVFLSMFGAFALHQRRTREEFKLRPFELIQLAFAAYRLGRMVAYDKVFETYRLPFAKTIPDPTGAGDTTAPRGTGARQALGELITCPICAGTWISAGLVYALQLFPNAARAFLAIFSAIGIAEFLDAATEALQWFGQVEREEAGTMVRHKRSVTVRKPQIVFPEKNERGINREIAANS
jgi:Protein of unknown function (DUF1360)